MRWHKDYLDVLTDDIRKAYNPLRSIREQEPVFYDLLKEYTSLYYWVYKEDNKKLFTEEEI